MHKISWSFGFYVQFFGFCSFSLVLSLDNLVYDVSGSIERKEREKISDENRHSIYSKDVKWSTILVNFFLILLGIFNKCCQQVDHTNCKKVRSNIKDLKEKKTKTRKRFEVKFTLVTYTNKYLITLRYCDLRAIFIKNLCTNTLKLFQIF